MTTTPTELSIDVPYGKLAARVWGPEDGRRVLALHGWLDSAATFDALVPLLDPRLRVVALDFSGHGDSSHRPLGMHYNLVEFLVDVRRVVDALGWKKFVLLAHSLGALVAFLYAGIFHDEVDAMISLDVVVPSFAISSRLPSLIGKSIKRFLAIEARLTEPPVYSREELMARMEEANPGGLTEESKAVLMRRGARVVDGGLLLKRDVRAKVTTTVQIPMELQKEILRRFKGNLLVIRAGSEALPQQLKEMEEEFKGLYRENCRRFKCVEVSGGHYVHLNEPRKVAPLINAFFKEDIFMKGKL